MTFAADSGSSSVPLSGLNTARVGVRYPSPFFDLAQTYLPDNPRALFRWARYYAMTYGPVYSFVMKMSAYALTRIDWGASEDPHEREETKQDLQEVWRGIFEDDLNIYERCFRGGLHYWTYGNWFSSVIFPFVRWLVCPRCAFAKQARSFPKKGYRWQRFRFQGQCDNCDYRGPLEVRDNYVRSKKGLRIKIWDPLQIIPVVNEATDQVDYYYKPSASLIRKVRRGDRSIIETTPWEFIRAIERDRLVKFNPENFLHIKAPSPDSFETGFGHPPVLAALKDIFHVQLMKRAQEANIIERCIPLTILHPDPRSQDTLNHPGWAVNLADYLETVRGEVAQARQDPNYLAMSAFPVARTDIWGEGKGLTMVEEIRGWTELVAVDLGVPQEFLFGGLSWTGSSVSLRMLENQILNFREGYDHFSHFVQKLIARFLRHPETPHVWKPFKMADDIQRKQQLLMLGQMNKVGDTTLLNEFDLKPATEEKDLIHSIRRAGKLQKQMLVDQTEAQIETQKLQMEAQMKMQQEMGIPAGGMEEGAMDPAMQEQQGQQGPMNGEENVVPFMDRFMAQLQGQPPEVIQQALQQLNNTAPDLAQMAQQQMLGQQGQMMSPQPEQGPPMRGPGAAAI